MRTSFTAFGPACALLLLVGCPSDDTPSDTGVDATRDTGSTGDTGGTSDTGAAGPRVELGTGTANFEEIPETGAEMELVAGSQGGWHLGVTARFYDLTIEGLILSYRTERDGMTISMPFERRLSERRLVRDGDRWLRAGDQLIFEITDPAEVVGSIVDVIVDATPVDGPLTSDRRTGVLVVDREP